MIEVLILRISAILFLISVVLNDEDYIVISNGRPAIGVLGLLLTACALGSIAIKNSFTEKTKHNTSGSKPLYTWDMVIIGIIGIIGIIFL
ncbi:MAG: hypothetical protein KDI50_03400 [Candidatus Competibacteraceae bacterium]|nr:hypothetical protein [Candidatus Competibacteraceae bacterium]